MTSRTVTPTYRSFAVRVRIGIPFHGHARPESVQKVV